MADDYGLLAGTRCLVLDDEFLIALDIQQLLETNGATVSSIGDATAAVEALAGGAQFDLAVLDIKLAGSSADSKVVAAMLTERGVPFVFLTGMRADNELAKSFPRAPLVEKPYKVETLLDALRKLVDGG